MPVGVEPFNEQGALVMQVLGHFLLIAVGDGLDFADEFGEECLLMGDLLLKLSESLGGGLMVLVDVPVADGEELVFSQFFHLVVVPNCALVLLRRHI